MRTVNEGSSNTRSPGRFKRPACALEVRSSTRFLGASTLMMAGSAARETRVRGVGAAGTGTGRLESIADGAFGRRSVGGVAVSRVSRWTGVRAGCLEAESQSKSALLGSFEWALRDEEECSDRG